MTKPAQEHGPLLRIAKEKDCASNEEDGKTDEHILLIKARIEGTRLLNKKSRLSAAAEDKSRTET
jgi:hypothetical protein